MSVENIDLTQLTESTDLTDSTNSTESVEKIIDVNMSKMAIIFMAPAYLADMFVEAGIRGDHNEQFRIIEQMHIEVEKGNVRPDPPKAIIKLFESMTNAQFKVNVDIDEYGEEHVKIDISDKNYVPVEGEERSGLLICGVTDVRTFDEKAGTATVEYSSSTGPKAVTVPIERVFSEKQREHLRLDDYF